MAQGFVGSGREPTGGSGEMWEKEGQGWASESMLLSGFPNRVECSHHRVPLVAVCLLELVAVAARVASAAQYSGTQRSVLSTQYSDSVLSFRRGSPWPELALSQHEWHVLDHFQKWYVSHPCFRFTLFAPSHPRVCCHADSSSFYSQLLALRLT